MLSRAILTLFVVATFAALTPLRAETLQQKYLDIYLKINDAEHLEKQNDFIGALDDFKDCYTGLQHIHDENPDWEAALVVHRMADCQAKILELQPKADQQVAQQQAAAAAASAAQLAQPTNPAPAAPVPPAPGPNESTAAGQPASPSATPAPAANPGDSDEVASLKLQLQAVKEELRITKENLLESQAQLETYRVQLQTVNAQLEAFKNAPTENEKMGKLMSENKELNDKLAAAEKELQGMKSNPSSRLALAETQLKNLQDEYEESQAANKALQDTTTTLKGQLDQAQSDLAAANQKLASMGPSNSDYATLKHENEMMREILTRELQEQAHRDMAKRLAQEEFDNLKLKSKVLQEQLDILGSPMTPPSDDEEKAFLESLKVSAPQIDGVSGNTFSAPASGTPAAPTTPAATPTAPGTTVAATTPAPAPDTNMASATPPATSPATAPAAPATPPANTLATTAPATPPAAPAMQDTTPGQPPVNIVMNGNGDTSAPPPPSTPAPTPAATPSTTPSTAPADTTGTPAQTPAATPASSTPPPAAPANSSSVATTTPPAAPTDPTVPVPPTGAPLGNSATATTAPATPPSDPNAPTKSVIPPGQTTVTSTTVTHGDAASAAQQNQTDPSVYATQARLPDDMKETAQEAADLFKNQNYDASAAKYQDIIDKYPESLYAWSNLGVVRFQQGKFDDALKALQQAVKLSPTDAFSYSNLGIVYYQLGQYENAIDALNSAKALDPNDAKTHNYLGCACSQKGWQEVAEKEFRKAIEIDPNFGDAHFNLALVYATSKPPSLELARREYNTALSLGIQRDARLEKLLGDTTGATSVGQSAPGQ